MGRPNICAVCFAPLEAKSIRSTYLMGVRVFVCKLCFLKLPEEYRSHRESKPQLPSEVTYRQEELPF